MVVILLWNNTHKSVSMGLYHKQFMSTPAVRASYIIAHNVILNISKCSCRFWISRSPRYRNRKTNLCGPYFWVQEKIIVLIQIVHSVVKPYKSTIEESVLCSTANPLKPLFHLCLLYYLMPYLYVCLYKQW